MPEHAHLLVRPREAPLSRALLSIKLTISRLVINRWKKLRAPILDRIRLADGRPRFWQPGGGFDRSVRGRPEFSKNACYIHRNPVKRGLVALPHQWA